MPELGGTVPLKSFYYSLLALNPGGVRSSSSIHNFSSPKFIIIWMWAVSWITKVLKVLHGHYLKHGWKLSAKIGNDFQYFVIINYKKVQRKQISTKWKIDKNSISKFQTVLFSDQRCQSYKQLKKCQFSPSLELLAGN